MSNFRRAALTVLVIVPAFCVLAADRPSVVTAVAGHDSVRFIASPTACQMRVQVIAHAGEMLLDSAWRDGNVLDWPMADLASGSYRCVIAVTDLDGTAMTSELRVTVNGGQVAVEDRAGGTSPKVTLILNDGKNGSIASTTGDLAFRFGDVLSGHDAERMRITADGKVGIGITTPQAALDVNGVIRTNKGIELPDGTMITSASELIPAARTDPPRTADTRVPMVQPGVPYASGVPARKFVPKTALVPTSQFIVDASGVHIGSVPAYGLDVAGSVTTSSNLRMPDATSASSGVLEIGGAYFMHNYGVANFFLGYLAGNFSMSGSSNTVIGYGSMGSNTSGSSNTAVGVNALLVNTTGSNNTALGDHTMSNNGSGGFNTAVGGAAMGSNTVGARNTAVGAGALYANTTGTENTAIGKNALGLNAVTTTANTATGFEALYRNSGSSNTAVGHNALTMNTTGGSNIGIGAGAGQNLTSGSGNIDVGNDGVAGESNIIRIGTLQAKTFIAGIRGVTTDAAPAIPVLIDANGQLGTTSSSRRFKFDIRDAGDTTSKLMQLRPVTFRYLAQGANGALQYGLIAEEVEEVYPELVARDKNGDAETVLYQFLPPMILNELQKQQRTIDELRATIASQERRLQALEKERPVR